MTKNQFIINLKNINNLKNYLFLKLNFLTAIPTATTNKVIIPPSKGIPGGGGGVLLGGVCANIILVANKTTSTNIILRVYLFIFFTIFGKSKLPIFIIETTKI